MGISHRSDIVPAIAHGVLYREHAGDRYVPGLEILCPVGVYEALDIPVKLQFDGWDLKLTYEYTDIEGLECFPNAEIVKIGKRSRIFCDIWYEKDGNRVYLINESPYESVGAIALAFVADKREFIEDFVASLQKAYPGLLKNVTIEENDTVEVTF
jgi:hypothetical protein